MSLELVKYRQPLTPEELAFLRKKESRERHQTYKVLKVFMVLSFICPFIVAWFRAFGDHENPFSAIHYFIGVVFLLVFSATGVYWGYYNNLRKIQKDIKGGTKTVEKVFITRKQYMPANNTYYFYLSSSVKLSIDVEEHDYRQLSKGDEINIEYTSFSNLYLGYFV